MQLTKIFIWRVVVVAALVALAFFSVATFVRAEGEEVPPPPVEEQVPATDGVPGEGGESGSDDPPPPVDPEPAIIETGDAGAGVNTVGETNNSEITSLSGDLSATTTNDATLDNDATSTAETGENSASSAGGALISTGDAVAFANVLNVVNTNIINSTGLIAFLNYIFGMGFDLRALGLDYFLNPSSTGCSLSGCDQSDVTLNLDNDAALQNDILVRADTGQNTANGGDGIAIIQTGDAFAAANLINVVNSSLIGSNYLLVVGNNFGNLSGDITLPGVDFFRQLFAAAQGGVSGPLDVTVVNDGTVTDTSSTTAGTGSNTADGGGSLIVTGDAVAGGQSANIVNTNAVGGTSFAFLINVIGDWSGSVFNLPDGICWGRSATGVVLSTCDGAGDLSALSGGIGGLTMNATNTAHIANNLSVYALTGDNYAGAMGGSLIDTGDAYAAANSVNIVNTNILGRNWIFAIFNIFGDWTGNVSFGKPDLWVGARVEAGNPTRPNTAVEYCFTVSNTGDADAHNVLLTPDFSPVMLTFAERLAQFGTREGWALGDIPRTESREYCYQALTGSMEPGRSVAVPLTVTATAVETEEDMADNSDIVTIVVESFIGEMFTGAGRAPTSGAPQLVAKKTASVATTTMGSSVDYTVVIRNDGGPVYRAKLTDVLKDPSGNTVYSRSWDLRTIHANEELTLTYTIEFNKNLPLGIYKNIARVTGRKDNVVDQYATDMPPVTVSSLVELRAGEPKVLGAQALAPACAEYITDYLRPGAQNKSDQVRRLQFFFRDFEGVSIATDGVFGPTTIAAVNNFQTKYESDVLGPWGMKKPSGYVYYTTRKKINEMYCQGVSEFPLSSTQESEIIAFKSGLLGSFAAEPKPAGQGVPVYVKPSVLEAPAPTGQRTGDKAHNFFDRLFEFGKNALVIPEVNAQGLLR